MLKISFFGSGPALALGPIKKGRPGPGPGPVPGPKKFAGPGPPGRAGPPQKKARNITNHHRSPGCPRIFLMWKTFLVMYLIPSRHFFPRYSVDMPYILFKLYSF